MPFSNKSLLAVYICDHLLKQVGALDKAFGDCVPFAGANDERHGIERPTALIRIPHHAEAEAKILNLPRDIVMHPRPVSIRQRRKPLRHRRPFGRNIGRCVAIKVALHPRSRIARKRVSLNRQRGRILVQSLRSDLAGRRRSSVNGNSLGTSSSGIASAPGECPCA